MRKLEKRGSGLVENCKQEEVPKQREGKEYEEEKGKGVVDVWNLNLVFALINS